MNFYIELYYLISFASVFFKGVVNDILEHHNLQADGSVVVQITTAVCSSNPVHRAIEKGSPLSTSQQRKQYYKEKFNVVEPITYILDLKKKTHISVCPTVKILAANIKLQSHS